MARLTATADPLSPLRETALKLLARREHSALELRHKLTRRGFDPDQTGTVLAELQTQGWLDDRRFAEIYAASRADKGYGPLRIRSELRERGVADTIIEPVLAQLNSVWAATLARLSRKRFGSQSPAAVAEKAKRLRFLRQRGFTLDQINRLFRPE